MNNKIELTPYQYASYWWVNRIREFVQDVIRVGYSSDEGVELTEMFDCLKDEHWRALYIKLSQLIEKEFKENGKFIQSTKSSTNDHYLGHNMINDMLKSILKVDIPNASLISQGQTHIILSISKKSGNPEVFLTGDSTFSNEIIVQVNREVEEDYILTGDKNLLNKKQKKLN